MWTSWSRGQTTHNEDDTTLKKANKSGLIGIIQWKTITRHQHYWNKKSLPNKYQFTNKKYKKDATRSVIPW